MYEESSLRTSIIFDGLDVVKGHHWRIFLAKFLELYNESMIAIIILLNGTFQTNIGMFRLFCQSCAYKFSCINDHTQYATEITCAKNTEAALIGYIQREESLEGDYEVNDNSDRLRYGIKRRRLDTSNDANHYRNHNCNDNDNEDVDEEHCGTEGNDGSEDCNDGDTKIGDERVKEDKAVVTILKKI
ncbi:hypothetical protein OCU04_012563 [Sclerotinia nivalis]|uniref:Uncharacterized protein n=1 Tax=Sclerotinia nivalis TaxID=352851 RepID=A0A9X0A8X8_9HELO|nr:hypothetical protein OCU04_012563 [Sclerotinia nivalis]